MAATYRRVNMKALARYQIILLGEQRHIGVNNLPKVVARQCSGRESNTRPAHRESSALTTTPPSHQCVWTVENQCVKAFRRIVYQVNTQVKVKPKVKPVDKVDGVCA